MLIQVESAVVWLKNQNKHRRKKRKLQERPNQESGTFLKRKMHKPSQHHKKKEPRRPQQTAKVGGCRVEKSTQPLTNPLGGDRHVIINICNQETLS